MIIGVMEEEEILEAIEFLKYSNKACPEKWKDKLIYCLSCMIPKELG